MRRLQPTYERVRGPARERRRAESLTRRARLDRWQKPASSQRHRRVLRGRATGRSRPARACRTARCSCSPSRHEEARACPAAKTATWQCVLARVPNAAAGRRLRAARTRPPSPAVSTCLSTTAASDGSRRRIPADTGIVCKAFRTTRVGQPHQRSHHHRTGRLDRYVRVAAHLSPHRHGAGRALAHPAKP